MTILQSGYYHGRCEGCGTLTKVRRMRHKYAASSGAYCFVCRPERKGGSNAPETPRAQHLGVDLGDTAIAGEDRALLMHLIDRHGLDGILMTLSEFCGTRGDELIKTDASKAKRWIQLEGALAVLVPAAFQL
jgi:hypothetical protein